MDEKLKENIKGRPRFLVKNFTEEKRVTTVPRNRSTRVSNFNPLNLISFKI